MKRFLTLAAAAMIASIGAGAAYAFTYENQGTTSPTTTAPKGHLGYADMNPSSVLPPISGTPVEGLKFDHGPSSYNNGYATQPTRENSVGPSWLYPPR